MLCSVYPDQCTLVNLSKQCFVIARVELIASFAAAVLVSAATLCCATAAGDEAGHKQHQVGASQLLRGLDPAICSHTSQKRLHHAPRLSGTPFWCAAPCRAATRQQLLELAQVVVISILQAVPLPEQLRLVLVCKDWAAAAVLATTHIDVAGLVESHCLPSAACSACVRCCRHP